MTQLPTTNNPPQTAPPPTRAAHDARIWFGSGFIAVGLLFLIETFWTISADWIGVGVLAAMGVAFLAAYRPARAWPVLPGGFFLACAATAASSTLFPQDGSFSGAVFLFGLAATFAAYYALAGARDQHRWALVLAVIAAGLAALVVSPQWMLPALLILAGVALLLNRSRPATG